ncbi:DUF3262 family protein, partial [Serratia ureilytica]|nr:DUF3262 family protein [Serratia ureilytica]
MLSLICIGGLLAVLFVWAAWALTDIWKGWSNEKLRNAAVAVVAVAADAVVVAASAAKATEDRPIAAATTRANTFFI